MANIQNNTITNKYEIPAYEEILKAVYDTISHLIKREIKCSSSKTLGYYIWRDKSTLLRFIQAFYVVVYTNEYNLRLLANIDHLPNTLAQMTIDDVVQFLTIRKSVKSATKMGKPLQSSVRPPHAP